MTLQQALISIKKATTAEMLFGQLTGDITTKLTIVGKAYRQFALATHEDRNPGDVWAREAFIKLQRLYDEAKDRIKDNTYGVARSLGFVKSLKHTYELKELIGIGNVSTSYLAQGSAGSVLVKVAHHRQYNDLLEHEAQTLTLFADRLASYSVRLYIPQIIESFFIKTDPHQPPRRVSVFAPHNGYVSLADVMIEYPKGVDPRHFVWMWKRLLTVLEFAHKLDIIHGAILPTHVLVDPKTHGLMLIDWCFSIKNGAPPRAMCNGYKGWYPPEVELKRNMSPSLDLYMAAECMLYVLGKDPGTGMPDRLPAKFARLLQGCLIANPTYRIQQAGPLFEEFDEAAKSVYGKPKFVTLPMAALEI